MILEVIEAATNSIIAGQFPDGDESAELA